MTKRAITSGMSAKHPIIPAEECQPNPQPPPIGAGLTSPIHGPSPLSLIHQTLLPRNLRLEEKLLHLSNATPKIAQLTVSSAQRSILLSASWLSSVPAASTRLIRPLSPWKGSESSTVRTKSVHGVRRRRSVSKSALRLERISARRVWCKGWASRTVICSESFRSCL